MTDALQNPSNRPSFQPSLIELQKQPWRYIGYKGFSEWAASDSDFFVIRRFDTLAARIILFLQWRISSLESDLDKLDWARMFESDPPVDNGSFSNDDHERRGKIETIYKDLKDYCE